MWVSSISNNLLSESTEMPVAIEARGLKSMREN